MIRYRLLLVILVASVASTALGQNEVTNGNFDVDVSSWSGAGGTTSLTRAALDSQGSATSGSGLLVVSAAPGFNGGVYQKCLPATAGSVYDFGGWVRVPSGQVAGGRAGIFVSFYSDFPSCSVGVGPNVPAGTYVNTDGSTGALDTWLLKTAQATAPATAQAAWIYLNTIEGPSVGTLSAYYDGIRFGATPTTPARLTSFGLE